MRRSRRNCAERRLQERAQDGPDAQEECVGQVKQGLPRSSEISEGFLLGREGRSIMVDPFVKILLANPRIALTLK